MTTRVEVSSEVLSWARERSRRDADYLAKRFPKLEAWESGDVLPTLNQLEDFAKATYTPIGYFFLQKPPIDRLPIPDFRTVRNASVSAPSPNLLDTIALCRQRQEWFRDFLLEEESESVPFVGALQPFTDVVATAVAMRTALSLGSGFAAKLSTWSAALSTLAEFSEQSGVLVMISGIVDTNTQRRLDPDEFRGFALADPLAPLIFVNGADTKAAQIFTLAHELVHVGINQSAVSNPSLSRQPQDELERWCNEVAGEFLVPMESFKINFNRRGALDNELKHVAHRFKVSTLVILRRAWDARYITWDEYQAAFARQIALVAKPREAGGGDFNKTQPVRMSKRFARAIIASALEGRTPYTEAFRLLGFHKVSTLKKMGLQLGVAN